MKKKKKLLLLNLLNFGIIFVLFLLRYSGVLILKIGQAAPVIILPLIVAIAIFFGELSGFTAGLFAGILMDTQVVGSSCFNVFALMLLGLISGLCSTYLLNKNLKSALCLSLCTSFIYFLFRYLVLFVFKGITFSFDYVISYFLPSVIYTSIFILPCYYFEKFLSKHS